MYLKRRSSSGFALAEMVISLAAVTLAIALVAGLGQQVMQLARSSKQTAAVVELRSKTTAITRNLDSWIGKLRSSPHTGAVFSACIPDPSTPVSVFKCPDVNADILNNDAELKRIAGTQLHAASVNVVDMLGEKLAGTIDAPVLYDLDGRICTSNCALKATGFMLRSNPANDSTPGSVKFVVKVEPHSRAKGQSPIRTSYLSIDVGSEWQQPSGLCPSGSIKVGYLSNGKPSCINPTKKCAANTVHLGLDGSGNPICKTPPVSCATAGGSVVINADGTDLVCATNLQSAVPCQSNEIFLGYYAGTGVPMCSSTNLSCPDGQIQIGIAQEGASLKAQCKTLPSCQDSQKISYDGSQFVCKSASVASVCNPGEVVVGINDDGSAKCEVQERNLASTDLTCPSGKYVSGLEPSGKVICADLPLVLREPGNGQLDTRNPNSAPSTGPGSGSASNSPTGSSSNGNLVQATGISLAYEVANSDSTTWECVHDINIKDVCGDEDGCVFRFYSQVEKGSGDGGLYDEVRTYETHFYMEQERLSNKNYPGLYGHTFGEYQFVLGVANRYEIISSPWGGWAYILNYKHAYCPGQNGAHGKPYSDPYTVTIMSHPNIKTRVIFKDDP